MGFNIAGWLINKILDQEKLEAALETKLTILNDVDYFEKYSNGELVRKLILTEGEIAEDYGEGEITEDDDFTDKIWEFAETYLQNDFIDNMFEFTFKRYQAG